MANMSALYAIYHGPKGLRNIAYRVHRSTLVLAEGERKGRGGGRGRERGVREGVLRFYTTQTLCNSFQLYGDRDTSYTRDPSLTPLR